jgi:hypothetical protein
MALNWRDAFNWHGRLKLAQRPLTGATAFLAQRPFAGATAFDWLNGL